MVWVRLAVKTRLLAVHSFTVSTFRAGSVEESIFDLQDYKLNLASQVIQSSDEQVKPAVRRKEEMLSVATEAIQLCSVSGDLSDEASDQDFENQMKSVWKDTGEASQAWRRHLLPWLLIWVLKTWRGAKIIKVACSLCIALRPEASWCFWYRALIICQYAQFPSKIAPSLSIWRIGPSSILAPLSCTHLLTAVQYICHLAVSQMGGYYPILYMLVTLTPPQTLPVSQCTHEETLDYWATALTSCNALFPWSMKNALVYYELFWKWTTSSSLDCCQLQVIEVLYNDHRNVPRNQHDNQPQ